MVFIVLFTALWTETVLEEKEKEEKEEEGIHYCAFLLANFCKLL